MNHEPRRGVNYGNRENHARLRMSAIKAILLVVIDVEDCGPPRPLLPGNVREVPVGIFSAFSGNLGP